MDLTTSKYTMYIEILVEGTGQGGAGPQGREDTPSSQKKPIFFDTMVPSTKIFKSVFNKIISNVVVVPV